MHVSSFSSLARQLRFAWSRHIDRVHSRRELEQASDRVLADMGLCRSDIPAVADGRYGRD